MPFIDTDEGVFVNTHYIVTLQCNSSARQAPADHDPTGSRGRCDITAVLADGRVYHITGERAIYAVDVLGLSGKNTFRRELSVALRADTLSREEVVLDSTVEDTSVLLATALELASLAGGMTPNANAELDGRVKDQISSQQPEEATSGPVLFDALPLEAGFGKHEYTSAGCEEELTDSDEELIERCIAVMVAFGRINRKLLERQLLISYSTALWAIGVLCARGYIAEGEGDRDREILVDFPDGKGGGKTLQALLNSDESAQLAEAPSESDLDDSCNLCDVARNLFAGLKFDTSHTEPERKDET